MSIFGILEGRDIKMKFENRNFAVPLPGKKNDMSPMEDLNWIDVVN